MAHRFLLFLSALLSFALETALAQNTAVNGYLHSGSIPNTSSYADWTLTTTEESDLIVSIGTEFSPYLQIFDASNNLIAQHLSNGGDRYSELSLTSQPPGTYRIRIGPRFSGVGEYIATVVAAAENTSVAAGDEGGHIEDINPTAGSLPRGDMDVWTVFAKQGSTIIAKIGTEFSPAIRIFSPEGQLIASKLGNGGDRTGYLTAEAPTTGVYTVLISARFSHEGDYMLTLASLPHSFAIPTNDEGGELLPNVSTSGDLFLGDLDFWSFSARKGDRLAIRAVTLEEAISLRLYDNSGQLVASMDGNGGDRDRTLLYDAEKTGSYFLSTGTAFIGATTPYALHLGILRPELTRLSMNTEGAEVDWIPHPNLILEASEDLENWITVSTESAFDAESHTGSFETATGRSFFRFRWE